MITFLTTPVGRHTVLDYLAGPGRRRIGQLRALTYQVALRRGPDQLMPGLYVFADLERLDEPDRQRARELWSRLAAASTRYVTLNEPDRVPTRLELLEALHERGVNDFRAWPATASVPEHVRYPVFLRRGSDHAGPRGGLLHDRRMLEHARARVCQRNDAGDWLCCEWVDTQDPDGRYRKYGATVVGQRVVPRHLLVSEHWVVKTPEVTGVTEQAAERAYCAENPHAEQLLEIFGSLGIEYGRADYHVGHDGRVRIWEINTNPVLLPLKLDPASERTDLVVRAAEEIVDTLVRLSGEATRAPRLRISPMARAELLARRRANPWRASGATEARAWQIALGVQRRSQRRLGRWQH